LARREVLLLEFANDPCGVTGLNVPGFPGKQKAGSRLVSIQDVHTFSSTAINEARIGYNFIRVDTPRMSR